MENNKPAERTQDDNQQDFYSDLSGLDTGEETLTRQEFKDETDINIMLSRFGVNQQQRVMEYGKEIDYNLDLQQALAAVDTARRANLNVPEELRSKYPTWREVLNGAENGQYQADLQDLADRKHRATLDEAERLEFDKEKTALQRRQRAERELRRQREDAGGTPEPFPKTDT